MSLPRERLCSTESTVATLISMEMFVKRGNSFLVVAGKTVDDPTDVLLDKSDK
jgi:polyhydroxyalkanoate synthesis regulator protein